jgi:hypothetical protein
MKARLVTRERRRIGQNGFADLLIWRVPHPIEGSRHDFKYSLAFVYREVCVVRYDNERGKGDHRHVVGQEMIYDFLSLDRLLNDFFADVREWLNAHGDLRGPVD